MQSECLKKNLIGEFVGTFIFFFISLGSVLGAVTVGANAGVFQVAIVWGFSLAAAIVVAGGLSGGHFNPAVTIAMSVFGNFDSRKAVPYILTQVIAAFVASAVLYGLFSGVIRNYEMKNNIIHGQPGSEATAMIFGEFYPNPGGKPIDPKQTYMTSHKAFSMELVGTMLFVLVIFAATDPKNPLSSNYAPFVIGLTLTALITILGPFTMCCLNPARDFGPRLFSAVAGWGSVPFTVNGHGWLTVYIIAPILGGLIGGGIYKILIKPYYQ